MNFISIRSHYHKKEAISKILAHNERTMNVDDLLIYKIEKYNKSNPQNQVKSYIPFENHSSNNYAKKSFDFNYKKMEEINKKKKVYTKKNANSLIEQVVSLSNEQAQKILSQPNGRQKLIEKFDELHHQIADKYGLKAINYDLHLDEGHINDKGEVILNVHAHLTYLNYDFSQEKSLWRTYTKKDFEQMQDLAGEIFSDLGFKRGISKSKTKKEHLSTEDYIYSKQQQDLQKILDTEIQISKLESEISEIQKELKAGAENKNQLKEDIKKLRSERKDLIITKKDFDAETTKEITNIFKKHKKTIGYDYESIKLDTLKLLKDVSNTNTQLSDLKALEAKYEALTTQNEKLQKNNNELSQDKIDIESKRQSLERENENLKTKNSDLEEENSTMKEFIKSDIVRKSQYLEFREMRKSKFQELKEKKQDKSTSKYNFPSL